MDAIAWNSSRGCRVMGEWLSWCLHAWRGLNLWHWCDEPERGVYRWGENIGVMVC
jgi:hypothetical protein